MALLSGTIPNMLNGVSQQPMILRLPTQGTEQINGYSSVVEGLQKRPPCKHIGKLLTGTPDNLFFHLINRDPTERYSVLIADGEVYVHDLTGVARTVTYGSGAQAYLSLGTGSSFEAVTVADYTFIVNRDVTPAMAATTSAAQAQEAVVSVEVGSPSCNYRIRIDDVEQALYLTSDTDPATTRTAAIALELYNDLVANIGVVNYTIQILHSYIYIKRIDGNPLDIKIGDDLADKAMKLTRNSIQRFSDVPAIAKHGMKVHIIGEPNSSFDDYYLEFIANDAASPTIDRGTWQETVAPATTTTLDSATMPHVLVRESNGTFTFRKATEWLTREVGDAESNLEPSFVGSPINSVFFFRNRLGFLTDDNVVMSETGDFFNFWRTTVTALLDSDRIDLAASDTRVAILRYAKPQGDDLVAFADEQQMTLPGGELLSPVTAELKASLAFNMDANVEPESSGRSIYFAFRNGDFAGIRQYSIQPDLLEADAPSITEHVSKYIEGRITRITSATHEDVLCVLADGDPTSIYVYKYYDQGANNLQSSWSRWTFCYPCTIYDCRFLVDTLYLVVQHGDGVYLESITVAAGQVDANSNILFHLDRRWAVPMSAPWRVYDAATDRTTITLPYAMPAASENACCALTVVTRPGAGDECVTTTTAAPAAVPASCAAAIASGLLAARYRIASYVDGVLGIMRLSTCVPCSGTPDTYTFWDGTVPVQVSCAWGLTPSVRMTISSGVTSSVGASLNLTGTPLRWQLDVDFSCSVGVGRSVVFTKSTGATPAGTYSIDLTLTSASLIGCSAFPSTIEIEEY